MKKIFLISLFLAFFTFSQAQNIHSAIKINASTDGAGADIVLLFNKQIAARVGGNYISLFYFFKYNNIKDVSLNADFRYKGGNVSAYLDFYLLKWLYITAGAGVSLFGAQAFATTTSGLKYGDIIIPAEDVGQMNISISRGSLINPYVGLGFGRTIPALKRVGFGLELGCTYLGSPKVSVDATGLLTPNMESSQIENYNAVVERYKFLPSLKLALSFKLF